MEIGGDFWWNEIEYRNNINKDFFEFGQDNKFVMAGRTAIDVALQDILKTEKVENVYFPSYACESMLQPFKDRNIKVDFYNVYFQDTLKYDIKADFTCDIFFAMNYFGYTCTNMEKYIQNFKSRGCKIIEDSTQSLLSNKPFSKYSDYVICSLRKWFPINCGGLISKSNGKLNIDFAEFETNEIVISNKHMAMKKKFNSIKENKINEQKDEILSLYKKANLEIKENYVNKLMDDESIKYVLNIDLNQIKNKRRQNVNAIYSNLKLNKYKLLIDNYDEKMDCLLYLPIYMNKQKLKLLKEKIYKEKFYCPSHWPIDTEVNDLFENELSIVCDQRYSEKQVKEKLILLNKFLEELQ